MSLLNAKDYLLMEAVARDRVDDLCALASAEAEPLCEICERTMEPIPPVGWLCLGAHEQPVA